MGGYIFIIQNWLNMTIRAKASTHGIISFDALTKVNPKIFVFIAERQKTKDNYQAGTKGSVVEIMTFSNPLVYI